MSSQKFTASYFKKQTNITGMTKEKHDIIQFNFPLLKIDVQFF